MPHVQQLRVPQVQADLSAAAEALRERTGAGIAGPLDRAAEMRCPVLGMFGGADQAIPVEQVEQFDRRLSEAGIEHEVHVYAGAPHSFFDRRYQEHAEASADAWRRMLAFLGRHAAGG